MQYSKKEVPLEQKDINVINTLTSFVKIIPIISSFILGVGALIALLVLPQFLGWFTAIVIAVSIIGFSLLVFFMIKKVFLVPITKEISAGIKIEHRGVLTFKRQDMTYNRSHGKHRYIETYYITLNEIEIKIGDISNYNNLALYESLLIGKNYKVSQSIRDKDLIFGVEETI